jgi:hypothetical protein
VRCAQCNRDHATDPVFPRPTAVVLLPRDARALRVRESDDLCVVRPWMNEREQRYFVRGVMFVAVDRVPTGTAWGLWAEVDAKVFETYVRNARSPDQAKLPALPGTLANTIRGYPETIGLPITLQMTSVRGRPAFSFLPSVDHPFAAEVRAGVTATRLHEWLTNSLG